MEFRISGSHRTVEPRPSASSTRLRRSPGYPQRETLVRLRERVRRSPFARMLDEAIPPAATVLELGCGTGQLSLFLAAVDRVVVGADLARASLELGARAATPFGVRGVLLGRAPAPIA